MVSAQWEEAPRRVPIVALSEHGWLEPGSAADWLASPANLKTAGSLMERYGILLSTTNKNYLPFIIRGFGAEILVGH
jgi:hypothetical protein